MKYFYSHFHILTTDVGGGGAKNDLNARSPFTSKFLDIKCLPVKSSYYSSPFLVFSFTNGGHAMSVNQFTAP